MTDYKHTWELDPDSKLLRYYAWCWRADPKRVDFCKLFWGLLFSIPGLFFVRLAELVTRWAERSSPPTPAPEPETSRGDEWLAKIGTFFASARTRTWLSRLALACMVIAGIALAVVLVVMIATNLVKLLLIFGCVLGVVAFVIGLTWLVARHESRLKRWALVVIAAGREVKHNTCPRIVVHEPPAEVRDVH